MIASETRDPVALAGAYGVIEDHTPPELAAGTRDSSADAMLTEQIFQRGR